MISAEIQFQKVLILDQKNEAASSGLAAIHFLGSYFDKARKIIDNIFHPETKDVRLLIIYGELLGLVGNIDKAESIFILASKLDVKQAEELRPVFP